jgi:predicted O-methyltransferase YrrM
MLINTRYELTKLINSKKYKVGVEVGVCEGYYSYYLLKHSNLKKLYSVDPWYPSRANGDNNFKNATSLLAEFPNRSVIYRETSMEAVKHFEPNSVDFVYIDGNHRKKFVLNDLRAWWNVVTPGGLIAGHDYVKAKMCGVIAAVDQFSRNRNLEVHYTNEHLKTWYFYKPNSD